MIWGICLLVATVAGTAAATVLVAVGVALVMEWFDREGNE